MSIGAICQVVGEVEAPLYHLEETSDKRFEILRLDDLRDHCNFHNCLLKSLSEDEEAATVLGVKVHKDELSKAVNIIFKEFNCLLDLGGLLIKCECLFDLDELCDCTHIVLTVSQHI